MAAAENDPLLLPVGHYLGPVYPGRDAPPSFHVVRLGWQQLRLSDPEHLETWLLCHGEPDRATQDRANQDRTGGERDATVGTRSAVLMTAAERDVADAEPALEDLLDQGLVVEVTPDDAESVTRFARSHRLQPLLTGIGHDQEHPLDMIGIAGLVVALEAMPRVFEVWQWAHLWPDLWSAGQALAGAAAGQPDSPRSETDPDEVLAFVVGAVHTLVRHGAAYLDVRQSPAPAGRPS
jgi:hypothetical protein